MSYRIEINPDDPQSIQRALNTEWLLTNGLGGYAMGTALGVNTRRYHGLLVAATKPPVGRILALHSMIEQLVIPREDGSEEIIDLSTQQFVGGDGQPMLHPTGLDVLTQFVHGPGGECAWVHRANEMQITKRLTLAGGDNGMRMTYSFKRVSQNMTLRVRPFTPLRDFHALESAQKIVASMSSEGVRRVIRVNGNIEVLIEAADGWSRESQQWHNFAYRLDRERGQQWTEHLYSPGCFQAAVPAGNEREFIVNVTALIPGDDCTFHLPNPTRATASTSHPNLMLERTRVGATAFIVRRRINRQADSTSVIAGYPWFGDWGRDTMIALPGLMLCTNRFDEARSCLMLYAQHLRNGLIPNVFDDYGGAAHYNTADASLWFVHAVHALWKAQRSIDDGLLNACRELIRAYRHGTDYNIFMDKDGLISAGDEGSQLTWMDAKRDGVVFTPRHGKAVEINALWFNALNCLAAMTSDSREREELLVLSRRVAESFRAKFWWQERACLFDVLTPNARQQLRPNQIFAASLPYSPLDEDQQRAVVKIVNERLFTPFGLRTLDRDDPEYRGRYEGNMFERDRAYHNGTVWPWLIGPYCEALLRVENFSEPAKRRVRALIQPLIDEMSNAEGGRCLGQIAEVYDGDTPHRPGGCPAQAWSVAEVLRILSMIESRQDSGV